MGNSRSSTIQPSSGAQRLPFVPALEETPGRSASSRR
nr:unnamed protein product [Callosobruchus chinensis]